MSEESGNEMVDTLDDLHLEADRKKRILELSRRKRNAKREVTKVKHHLEKVLATPNSPVECIESCIDALWAALEQTQDALDELSTCYLDLKDEENQNRTMKEAEDFEMDCQQTIEKAQSTVIAASKGPSENTGHVASDQNNEGELPTNNSNDGAPLALQDANTNVVGGEPLATEPLKVPIFDGNKAKIEEYWMLFLSLVDASQEHRPFLR
ncbi:hypothetical protein AC249_AIPGENE9496 [Exaiptasia diaphana]|nr:hypothetical protein AC249_AIPGENE9496 [Exaiptasia diaphana]